MIKFKPKTLRKAREELQAQRRDGLTCPCCDQFVKEYHRPLNSSMVRVLILLYKNALIVGKKKYIHVENFLKELKNIPSLLRGDFAKLKYWGLLSMQGGVRSDGSTRIGFYRVTKQGALFVEKKIQVPKHVYLYNAERKDFGLKMIGIDEALGKHFNYRELMDN